jgi:hypothetical protein
MASVLGFHRLTQGTGARSGHAREHVYAALQYKWCGAKIKDILGAVDKFSAFALGNALKSPKFVG